MSEHDDVRRRGASGVVRREQPAEMCSDLKRAKEIGRGRRGSDPLGLVSLGEVPRAARPRADDREPLDLRGVAPDFRRREPGGLSNVIAAPDDGDPFGLPIGQGTKEHRLHDAEDRRVRADAEREREEGDDREARCTGEAAQRVGDVREQSVHGSHDPGGVHDWTARSGQRFETRRGVFPRRYRFGRAALAAARFVFSPARDCLASMTRFNRMRPMGRMQRMRAGAPRAELTEARLVRAGHFLETATATANTEGYDTRRHAAPEVGCLE
jgi:hypothetical protein